MSLFDFQILQRNEQNVAPCVFDGELNEELTPDFEILCRVARQDDNFTILYWTPCKVEGKHWEIQLLLPAGGLYRIEACRCKKGDRPEWSDRVKAVSFVGVGDLYMMCGQSNMTGYGRDCAYDPSVLGVHTFGNDGKWAIGKQPLFEGPDVTTGCMETVSGTSPALSFARRLHERTGLPIGLVPACIGGTPLSAWNPKEEGGLYRAVMVNKFNAVGKKVKGMIWLQGCSDSDREQVLSSSYFDRFKQAVACWRESFGNIPVLVVQINRWVACNEDKNDVGFGQVKMAHTRAMKEIDNVWTVPSYDLFGSDGIHNSSNANITIGERLANTALVKIYGEQGLVAPTIDKVVKIGDNLLQVFISHGHHVRAMDNVPFGMDIEDKDGITPCIRADFQYENPDILTVRVSRNISLPAKLHYAWRAIPPAIAMQDNHGMPLLACYGVEVEEQ